MKAPDPSNLPRRTPLAAVLDFASNIWTGVALLAVLLVYSSVGSAVPALRQLRLFEMTEFEWFHWWPFKAMVGLVCTSMVIATLRRIRLTVTTYGVWMIHTGILVLAIGSVIYFSTKVEGDAPVARREVTARLPGGDAARMVAYPGNTLTLGTDEDTYRLQVASIDPQWEILSGDDKGKRCYKVSVMVTTPQRTFMRELLDGYPMYTEDLVRSTDPGPPWTRAKKALGTPLVDDDLQLALAYAPQEWYYLSSDVAKCWALYLREVPADGAPGSWVERPIGGLPLYNDYVANADDVWLPAGTALRSDPLHVEIAPAPQGDPLAGAAITATGYLRYAVTESHRRGGGDTFDPALTVRLQSIDGRGQEFDLAALDPEAKTEPGGRMAFEWAPTQEKFDALVREPLLRIKVPAASIDMEFPIREMLANDPGLPFQPIEGTPYSYRVQRLHDALQIPGGGTISVAAVEIRSGDRAFVRWVADDPARTRDMSAAGEGAGHGDVQPTDAGIAMEYVPGPPMLTIVAGPDPQELHLIAYAVGAPPAIRPLTVGSPLPLSESVNLTVSRYYPNTQIETRPTIVPESQRDRDAKVQLAMVQVVVPGVKEPVWLRYHHWPFEGREDLFARAYWQPTVLDLPDGRRVEMIFSRQRRKLPAPVILDDFVMETNVGGYTGGNLSVRNWTSRLRFQQPQPPGGWGDPLLVSLNDPQEFGGLWYFQAQWDPPNPQQGSGGLNYTVLGVGTRHGVNIMLLGCCLSVVGMIYAFYVKPVIKRKRLAAAAAVAGARPGAGPGAARELAQVGGGKERP